MSTDERRSVLGHEFTDILNATGDASRAGLVSRLRRGFEDFVYILKLRSHLLNEHFESMSGGHVKASFRLVILYHSLLLFAALLSVISGLPFGGYRIGGIPLYCGLLLVIPLNLLTVYNFSTKTYTWMSVCYISLVGLILLFHMGSLSVFLPVQNGLLTLFIFITYTQSSVSVAFTVTIQCLLSFGLAILESFKTSHWLSTSRRTPRFSKLYSNSLQPVLPIVRLYLMGAITGLAIYLKIFISMRFKSSFLRICHSVHMSMQRKRTQDQQTAWIDAVMPQKVRAKYLRMVTLHRGAKLPKLLFFENYDPVSVLFSDISGFTSLWESSTPSNLLILLNFLFTTFDNLCNAAGCARIGALGSVYYCVSGCPSPRSDHAECCVTLALLMMDAVRRVKDERRMEITLSVGIHTGNVNAAVVGLDKFRFDIYSHCVVTAQKLLATCVPGRIRISGDVLQLLPSSFKTSPGQSIMENREVQSAIAGKKLVAVPIATYYLEADFDHFASEAAPKRNPGIREVFHLYRETTSVRESQTESNQMAAIQRLRGAADKGSEFAHIRSEPFTKSERPPNSLIWNVNARRGRKSPTFREYVFGIPVENQGGTLRYAKSKEMNILDNEIIAELHIESKNLSILFNRQILKPFSLRFRDSELEKSYRNRSDDPLTPVYIDSVRLAAAFDAVFLCLYRLVFLTAYVAAVSGNSEIGMAVSCFSLILTILLALPGVALINFGIFKKSDEIGTRLGRRLHRLGRSRRFARTTYNIIGQLPTIDILLVLILISSSELNLSKDAFVLFFGPPAIFIHCLPTDSPYIHRCASSAFSTFVLFLHLLLFTESSPLQRLEFAWFYEAAYFQPYTIASMMVVVMAWLLVVRITRLNETTCRLDFYLTAEAERTASTAKRTIEEYNNLVYNVVPEHVVKGLLATGVETLNTSSVNHITVIPQVGVAFIRLINFFDGYYREDYQSGKHAISLFNHIICSFDRHLRKPEYKEVEKLRTYSDSYMVAAGLDMRQRERTSDRTGHLTKLLQFCHSLLRLINKFNRNFILGQENAFELAIGVDVGTACAGLIGSTQPFYHLIGQPADVAYLLHLASPPGKIVVSEDVKVILGHQFQFETAALSDPPSPEHSYYYFV